MEGLNIIAGLGETLLSWRFLVILFAVELWALYYFCGRRARFADFTMALVALITLHEALYYFDLTPNMDWFTVVTDPYVKSVLRYQWLAYLVVLLAFAVVRLRPAPGARREPTGLLSAPEALPLVLIITVALSQQIFGFFSDYWLFQGIDSRRYIKYGLTFFDHGFKAFADTWLLLETTPDSTQPVHRSFIDLPLIPLLWGLVMNLLVLFSNSPVIADIASHIVSFFFWALSIAGTYLLGREIFDRRVGSYAALFSAFIPHFLYSGYLLMIDVPLTALITLSVYAFIRAVKKESAGAAVGAGLAALGVFFTKFIGIYLLWVIALAFVSYRRPGQWRPLIVFGATIAAGTAIIALLLFSLYGGGFLELTVDYVFRVKRLLGMHMVQAVQDFTTQYHRGVLSVFFYFQFFTAYLSFALSALIMVSLFLRYKVDGGDRSHLFLIIWPLSIMLYFSFLLTRTDRFIFSAYPAIAVIAAYGFIGLRARLSDKRLGLILLAMALVEMAGKHIACYYGAPALKWIVGWKILG